MVVGLAAAEKVRSRGDAEAVELKAPQWRGGAPIGSSLAKGGTECGARRVGLQLLIAALGVAVSPDGGQSRSEATTLRRAARSRVNKVSGQDNGGRRAGTDFGRRWWLAGV